MSIDIHLKLEEGIFKITKEELERKLSDEFNFARIFEDKDKHVTDFEIKPKNLPNPEDLLFTFHVQPEGHLWHPVPTRSDEGFKLDSEILDLISDKLDLEIEYPL